MGPMAKRLAHRRCVCVCAVPQSDAMVESPRDPSRDFMVSLDRRLSDRALPGVGAVLYAARVQSG